MSKEKLVPELITDPEFESCIPPLTQEEFDLLEENIIDMGINTDGLIDIIVNPES